MSEVLIVHRQASVLPSLRRFLGIERAADMLDDPRPQQLPRLHDLGVIVHSAAELSLCVQRPDYRSGCH